MKNAANQLEFVDQHRGMKRPSGGGQVIGGFFVFHAHAQRVDQVAFTIGCTDQHIYNRIQEGEFPNAVDISSDTARIPCYRIPREDVLEYIEASKEKARTR